MEKNKSELKDLSVQTSERKCYGDVSVIVDINLSLFIYSLGRRAQLTASQ